MASASAKVVSDEPGLRALAPAWDRLADRQAENRPFSGPGFTMAALRAYHAGAKPAVVATWRDEELAGVFPLIQRPLRRAGIPIAEIGFPHNPNVILNDPLLPVDEAGANAALEAAFGVFRTLTRDTVLLDSLPLALAQRVIQVAAELGWGTDGLEPSRSLYFIRSAGSYADYLATRSSDHRWQLKKVARRAQEAGRVEVIRHTGRRAIAGALSDWFAVERKSWQAESPESAMSDADRRFMEVLLEELRDDEVGDLWILRLDGTPIAALRMIGTTHRTCVHTMHYDQAYKALTPGTILLDAMLSAAFEAGLTEIDLHGNTTYFKRWATDTRDHATVRLYRPGAYGRLLRNGRGLLRRMQARSDEAAQEA